MRALVIQKGRGILEVRSTVIVSMLLKLLPFLFHSNISSIHFQVTFCSTYFRSSKSLLLDSSVNFSRNWSPRLSTSDPHDAHKIDLQIYTGRFSSPITLFYTRHKFADVCGAKFPLSFFLLWIGFDLKPFG